MANKIFFKNKQYGGLFSKSRQVLTENNSDIKLNGVTCTNVEDELDAINSKFAY